MKEAIECSGLVDSFWAKVRKTRAGCWNWRGYRDKDGYGQYAVRGLGNLKAHRVALALTQGDLPTGAVVRHTCDNPRCCNPAHLLVGTHADNVADRVARGRSSRLGNPKRRGSYAKNPRTTSTHDSLSVRELLDMVWAKRLKNQQLK